MRDFLIAAVLIIFLAPAANAARVDPLSKLEKLPEKEDEAELWDIASTHENNLRNSGRVFHNRHVETYLESITDRMLGSYLDHLGIEVDFVLVEEATLSGWVYPYGTIAVHTGLLAGMENEAQLASILAHEISHFLQRHSYRELITEGRQSAIGKGLGLLATIAVAAETGAIDTSLMSSTEGLWTNLVTSGYSRKLEYVADEEGLELMAKANYPRDQAVLGFKALGDNALYGADDPRKLWSSHPKLESRIENLRKEIGKERRKKKNDYKAGVVPPVDSYYRGIAPALIVNARLDIREQQFDRARAALRKYILVKPDDPEAEFLVGETYRKAEPDGPDYTQRLNAYRRALEKDSGYAPAHKELGMTYRRQRKSSEAIAAFEQYLNTSAEAADAGIIRGYVDSLR
jgi:predicted Zn-dependent protease